MAERSSLRRSRDPCQSDPNAALLRTLELCGRNIQARVKVHTLTHDVEQRELPTELLIVK